MKQIVTVLITGFLTFQFIWAQKVDSIKVEQSGDFIKIGYKILDSNEDQIFRVKVFATLKGNLKTELESVSGDAGDRVIGGKSEYWVIWDVLKDVDEVYSVDFIVRAELVKDLRSVAGTGQVLKPVSWDKKRMNILFAMCHPGPKVGVRLAYMGKFGASVQYTGGKLEKGNATNISPQGNSGAFGLDITKRLVNVRNFQLHLLAGVQNTALVFLDSPDSRGPVYRKNVSGPEVGLLCGISKVSFGIMGAGLNPRKIEDETGLVATTQLSFISLNLGIRF